MKTLILAFSALMTFVPAHAQEAPAVRETWHIKKNYDTLPCFSIQQTQALTRARTDGVTELVKEAEIFHEKTKAFFQKNKKFVCPPVLDYNPKGDKTQVAVKGTVNAFEEIYIVFPWQMEIQSGTNKEEIWKVNFSSESGVGFGKTKKLKNAFTLVPLIPRDSDKSPYLVHSMKIPGHDKELIRVCYPYKERKACNPYKSIVDEQQEPPTEPEPPL